MTLEANNMKKFAAGLLLFLMVALFYSCTNNQETKSIQPITTELSGNAQGTTFYIKLLGKKMDGVEDSVSNILDEIDRCFSLWRDDSELVKMNNSHGNQFFINDPKNYFREVGEANK